jgi:hypothetical protein
MMWIRDESNIAPENSRHRFSGIYKNLRLIIEALPSGGWFAGVYDLEIDRWLWTEYVSDAGEGKALAAEILGIAREDIVWNEYVPLPIDQN